MEQNFSESERTPKPKPFELREVEDRNIHGPTFGLRPGQPITIGNIRLDGSRPLEEQDKGMGMLIRISLLHSIKTHGQQLADFNVIYELIDRGKESEIYLRVTEKDGRARITIEAPERFRITLRPERK